MENFNIYIIYNDNHFELFTKDNSKNNVKYIGIEYNGQSFAICLKDPTPINDYRPSFKLFLNKVKCPKESDLYTENIFEALTAWEYINKTKHIRLIGSEIPFDNDNEYIPSLPILVVMFSKIKEINEALLYVGGDEIGDGYYLSCTEYSDKRA